MDGIIVAIWRSAKKLALWSTWLLLSLTIFYVGSLPLVGGSDTHGLFSPGPLSDTHYSFEDACGLCHKPFAAAGRSCAGCHEEIVSRADFSHTPNVNLKPVQARMGVQLTADGCTHCHAEHKGQQRTAMLVSMAAGFCQSCHEEVVAESHSHAGLSFEECRTCHNYHDNRFSDARFVQRNRRGGKMKDPARLVERNHLQRYRQTSIYATRQLAAADNDAPDGFTPNTGIVDKWAQSRHADAGVNCSFCHTSDKQREVWEKRPEQEACSECHANEVDGFLDSRHGMGQRQGLPPLALDRARLAMSAHEGEERVSTCFSCHPSHRFDTREAAVEACLSCHDDEHSRGYKGSLHYTAWQAELKGEKQPGEGVSCATCHLPREAHGDDKQQDILVQHNVSGDLRPKTKMIRGVCVQCHGLKFTLRALSSDDLVKANFVESPGRTPIPLIKFVKRKKLGLEQ